MSEQDSTAWADEIARRVGRRVAAVRAARRMSAQQLADRLLGMGHEISRASLSQLENGRRGVSVPDLLAIAWALDTSPAMLLVDPADGGDFRYIPEAPVGTIDFVEWWSGAEWPDRSGLPHQGRALHFHESTGPLQSWREMVAQDERRAALLGELADAYSAEWSATDPESRERGDRLRRALEQAVIDARQRAAEASTGVPWIGAEYAALILEEGSHLERVARVRQEGRERAGETDGDG